MKIETKFNAGDKVWFIHESKAIEKEVHSIKIEIEKSETFINYFINMSEVDGAFNFNLLKENQLFTSKQSLIDNI